MITLLPELPAYAWALLALAAVIVGFSKTALPGINTVSIAIFAALMPARESTGALLILLIVFLFIFFGVASADHSRGIAVQMGVPAPATIPNGHVGLYTLLPLLLAGILVGATGLVLSRKRARRRFDYNYQTQLLLVILSVGGLAIFFVLH